MPAVGSSRNRSAGSWTSAQASSSRRCIPPDSRPARRPRTGHRSSSSSTSRVRRPRERKSIPNSEPTKSTFSRTVRSGNRRERLRHVADPLARLPAERLGSSPRTVTVPGRRHEGAGQQPDRRRLARARRADQPEDGAGRDDQRDVVDRELVGEPHADAIDSHGGGRAGRVGRRRVDRPGGCWCRGGHRDRWRAGGAVRVCTAPRSWRANGCASTGRGSHPHPSHISASGQGRAQAASAKTGGKSRSGSRRSRFEAVPVKESAEANASATRQGHLSRRLHRLP